MIRELQFAGLPDLKSEKRLGTFEEGRGAADQANDQ
jgi:hypothetical protein